MSPILQITLAILLLALGAALVPLLLQLRKTAMAMEELAKSTQRDISRVADDVHQIRIQVDEVTVMAKEALSLPSTINRGLQDIFHAVPSIFNPKGSQFSWMNLLLGGVQAVMGLFNRPAAPTKETPHE